MSRVALCGPLPVASLQPWLEVPADRPLPRGSWGTPVAQLARAYLRAGEELVVVTLSADVTEEVVLRGPLLELRVRPSRQHHRARDGFRAERRHVAAALRSAEVDIAHAHWSYEYALGALDSRTPTLVTVRDWAPTMLRMMPDPYRAVRLLLNLEVLARARHLTVTSPYMRDRLRRWGRRDVPVIPNALDDDAFVRADEITTAGRAPMVLAANNGVGRRKNAATLLEAFPAVRRAVPDMRLQLVGDGYEPDGEAARLAGGPLDGVEFAGALDHESLLRRMGEAQVFVHPSREESFGMVLVEAMSQGTPVVAGRRSGAVPWVLDEGRAGVLTDITDPQALAGALSALLSDAARREAVARAGHARAWSSFRLSGVVGRYRDCYQAVLQAARGRRA